MRDMVAAGHMGRYNKVWLLPERIVRRQWLGLSDINGSRRDLTFLQRLQQNAAFHCIAASAVYKQGTVFHHAEALLCIKMHSLFRVRQDGEHHVRPWKDAINIISAYKLVYPFGANPFPALNSDDICSHGLHQLCILQAYLSKAYHKHRSPDR